LEQHPVLSIVGVDISKQMWAKAQHKFADIPHGLFKTASASHLPLLDRSFELMISANAFHYFLEPKPVLREMKHVLKPGGTIAI
jgi:ubiquinone/menaquinone biosynthesis C-methylase UbiE